MEYEWNAGFWTHNYGFYGLRTEHRCIMKRQSWTLRIQKKTQMDLKQNVNGMHDFGKIILDSMDLEQNIDIL